MDKDFTKDTIEFYTQLHELGDRARNIITAFVKAHGGSYTIDIDNDDHAWVGEEIYATALKTVSDGTVIVSNSAEYSEYLNEMDDYNILDLANYLVNL